MKSWEQLLGEEYVGALCEMSHIAGPRVPSWGCDILKIYHTVHDIKFISRDVLQELNAPVKNNEKWRQWAQVEKSTYVVFEVASLKTLETNIRNDCTIIYHDSFHAILQSTLENTLFESKTESDILEGMLKNWKVKT